MKLCMATCFRICRMKVHRKTTTVWFKEFPIKVGTVIWAWVELLRFIFRNRIIIKKNHLSWTILTNKLSIKIIQVQTIVVILKFQVINRLKKIILIHTASQIKSILSIHSENLQRKLKVWMNRKMSPKLQLSHNLKAFWKLKILSLHFK